MKTKIIISEQQAKLLMKTKLMENYLVELMNMGMTSSAGSNQNMGAVEISKQDASNLTNVQKYTSKGIDVKVMSEENVDEELGNEQQVNLKHRFEGKNLNIFSTRDKVTLREVLKYINSIPDQPMVEDSFSRDKVNLYVKIPSSGRYKHLGSFTPEALGKFKEISDREAVTGEKSDALNEQVSL